MTHTLCNTCVLPDNYTGIKFDNQGKCNYCNSEKERKYLGKEKLESEVHQILSNYPNRKYDCVVGLSGGRDSTYMLWYVVTILKLKALAVFIDSGLIPEQTIKNIHETVNKLHVDLKTVQHNYLKNSFRWHLLAWLKRPVPETLVTLCVGCRLGLHKFIDMEAIKQKIPIIFIGGSPFEGKQYKSNIVKTKFRNNSKISFVLGYLKQIVLNPLLILNPYCLFTQIKEYYITYFSQNRLTKKHHIHRVAIYHWYVRWEKQIIEKTLKEELNWNKHPGLKSNYRGDCEIGIIRQYLYWKLLGYNDKDDHLSCLIRDNQISRDEALKTIETEHYISEDVLSNICRKNNINYEKFKTKIDNLQTK